jgi:hypothetical protein
MAAARPRARLAQARPLAEHACRVAPPCPAALSRSGVETAKEAIVTAVTVTPHPARTRWCRARGAARRRPALVLALALPLGAAGRVAPLAAAPAAPAAAQTASVQPVAAPAAAQPALLAALPPALTAAPPAISATTAAAAPAADSSAAPAPAPSRAPSWLDKLSFHAYLNQAYAISQYHQIFGVPTSGTADYRTIGLQSRYAVTPNDSIVIQLLNFRFGQSPINKLYSDVELELGFYQHLFADGTAVKVGKMQLPLGIYNEIRDIGTLLPFYAPPSGMYLETYASRALEGAMVSRSFGRTSPWSVDVDLYGGGWNRPEETQATGVVTNARIENAAGTEVWLNTPLPGVRLGGGYAHLDGEGSINQVHRLDPQWIFHLSFDGTFDRFYVRSEIIESGLPDTVAPGVTTPRLTYRAYYAQAGCDLTAKLSLNLQADFSAYNIGLFDAGYTTLSDDDAVSLVYRFRPDLVAKIEGHRNRGSLVEYEPATSKTRTNYGIASLAVTF